MLIAAPTVLTLPGRSSNGLEDVPELQRQRLPVFRNPGVLPCPPSELPRDHYIGLLIPRAESMREARGAEVLRLHELTGLSLEMLLRG